MKNSPLSRWIAALAFTGAAPALSWPVGASASLTPAALLSSALANARLSSWVHVSASVITTAGSVWEASDVSEARSRLYLTSSQGATMRIVYDVATNTMYVVGNTYLVASLFPAATAPGNDVGHWFYGAPTGIEALYVPGLSITGLFAPSSSTRTVTALPVSTKFGIKVVGLSIVTQSSPTTPQVTEVVYVSARGPALPVAISVSTTGVSELVHFSRWDVPVHWSTPHGQPLSRA